MRLWLCTGFLLALALAAPMRAAACSDSDSPAGILDIGLSDAPPFVILKKGVPPGGLSVELWRRVEAGLIEDGLISGSRLVRCDAIKEINIALREGSLDMALSPLTVTTERLDIHDMSRQYFLSGLTVATLNSGQIAFDHALDVLVSTLFRPGTMQAMILFLLFNLVLAILIRWLLRDARARSDADGAARPGAVVVYVDPFLEAIERTLGLKGISDASSNFAGRLLEIFMAIIGAALSAALLGVLTSAFVSAIGQTERLQADDLLEMHVGVVADSSAEDFLIHASGQDDATADICQPLGSAKGDGLHCSTTETITQLVDPLIDGTVDVVLGDWAELTYLSRIGSSAGEIKVEDLVFRNEPLGWGYGRTMTDLVEHIDRELIENIRSPDWRRMVQQHMGSGSISPD